MKVVLLAGGFGTRISEESQFKPKPMIEIGGMPILWHIMKEYSHFGFNEFIICAGYKQHVIKNTSPIIFFIQLILRLILLMITRSLYIISMRNLGRLLL